MGFFFLGVCVCLAAPALWHDRRGDVPAGSDAVRGLAGRLAGHSSPERSGGGADETTQARQRGEVRLGLQCRIT